MKRLILACCLYGFQIPAFAQVIRIDPQSLSAPPYSYDKASVKVLAGKDVEPKRYITYLGSWENNGEANWERSTWWGRFYVDCKDSTFRVQHFKHRQVGSWRQAGRNYTALYGYEFLCKDISSLPAEPKTILELDEEFTREYHDKSVPFKAIY